MSQITLRDSKPNFNLLAIYRELWSYRSFLLNWTQRELEMRYRSSILGVLWNLLNPLLTMLIYYFVFSRISRDSIPNYLSYIFSGLIPWFFTAQLFTRASDVLWQNANVLGKVYLPKEVLVISLVLSGLINFLITCAFILPFIIWQGQRFSFELLWFLPVVALHCLFLYSSGLLLSALGVLVRDLGVIMNTLISLLFFLTPVLYLPTQVSEKFALIIANQPIAILIGLYRDVLYSASHPNWTNFGLCLGANVLWYLVCHYLFRRVQPEISDLI